MSALKLKKLKTLLNLVRRNRQRRRIVFTNGCFDLLHLGHIRLLEKAKRLGDTLIVGLNSDRSVRRLKGPARPINPESARAELLSALKAVDYVVIFQEDTPEKVIRTLRPDILVKGGDWKRKGVIGQDFVASYGGKTVLLPLVKGYSTTRLYDENKKNH